MSQLPAGPLQAEGAPRESSSGRRWIGALIAGIGTVAIAVIVLLAAGAGSWFSPDDTATAPEAASPQSAQSSTGHKDGEQSVAEKVARRYGEVLDTIDTYDFLGGGEPEPGNEITGYGYALSDMTGDGIPELIVRTEAPTLTNVRVFSVTPSADEVLAPDEALQTGAASAGGFRASVSGARDGSGLYYEVVSSGLGDVRVEKVTIEDGKLAHAVAAEYSLDPSQGKPAPDDLTANTVALEFTKSTDRAPLDTLAAQEFQTPKSDGGASVPSSEGAEQATDDAASLQKQIDEARASGAQVFEGTVRVLSYTEVLDLQGISDPNPGTDAGSQFAILVFDGDTSVTGNTATGEGSRTENAALLLLDSYSVSTYGSSGSPDAVDRWRSVDGMRVVVACGHISFPSDTRLPLGEPGASDARVLSQ